MDDRVGCFAWLMCFVILLHIWLLLVALILTLLSAWCCGLDVSKHPACSYRDIEAHSPPQEPPHISDRNPQYASTMQQPDYTFGIS